MKVKTTTKASLDKAVQRMREEGYELFIVAFDIADRRCICGAHLDTDVVSGNIRADCTAHEPKVEVLCSAVREREQMQIMAREVLELAATPPAIQVIN